MAFVQFSKVSLAFGDRDILKKVSVNLAAGSKAALTGANGSGKSTLMKIMAGLILPDSGERIAQKDARVAYLPQSGIVHSGCSLREEADRAFEYGYALQRELEAVGDALQANPANPAPLLERHHEISTKLEESGWYRREAFAEQVLLGLGFSASDLDRQVEEFSGGWQMRVALAKALMQGPDILLLDEPTNYLDLEARNWLEQFLLNFKGGFLLVSHDRYFLDVTITEVYELFNGDLHRYPGNYTHYEQVRQVELESLIANYNQQQEEIRKLEDFIRRFGAKATKAAQAQERQKMLDKVLAQKIEIPESLKKIRFSFPPAPHSGRLVLTLEQIGKSYDGVRRVIENLDLVVENGERLVVAGRNGSGKSTLLRILAAQDASFAGTVKTGAGVAVGYFSQDSAETITGAQSVLDYIEQDAPLELIPKLRDMLGAFLFRGDDVFKSLNVLSGGEKSRLALLRLLLRPVNLLILDEPTNHLDLHSKDVLLGALKDFGGTVVFVSHDRGFIESLATRVLELTPPVNGAPPRYRVFPGSYAYYLDRLAAEAAGAVPGAGGCGAGSAGVSVRGSALTGSAAASSSGSTSIAGASIGDAASRSNESSGAQRYEEQKRLKNERRRLEREEERLMEEIAAAEEDKAALEARLAEPAVYSDAAECRAVQQLIENAGHRIEELSAAWEAVSAQLA
ncbi:ABC-F family ATP-binding cassette domain-containing protein [Treponema brennaborense]|uniref:ABC transporter related protein n=1 Tax=Treponema brennaborense (strain DSM 12168 / CIP 105900 / DD5/3) TaxID=906968 RepID=F4LPI4_TREBD|nr:ABC-F family ATP-binding cassette domain-containing protein [Treponema brennaborense]AEE15995.1 ABC transporter related protein [Treponema brennaborense DSM 12168]